MFGPFYYDYEPLPPKKPTVGARYRKRSETLDWLVTDTSDEEVKLLGPGICRGVLRVSLENFSKEFVRS